MKIYLENVQKMLQDTLILNNITITFESGHIYGLCGCNGCGKTMLMRLICGLISPTKGKVLIDDKILGKDFDFVPNTGLLLETPVFLKEYDGFNNLKILADLNNKVTDKDINNVLCRVGLDNNIKKVKKYSLGMKQRLGIATVIMESPDLVIFDEPTNALDSNGVKMFQEILLQEKERGALIIIACHDDTILKKVSDVICYIENGKIIKNEKVEKNEH